LEAIQLYLQTVSLRSHSPRRMRPAEPVVLQVSGEFESLMPGFLEHRRQELVQIADALDRGEFETIREIGHGLKGTGGTYGLEAISAYGRALETAAGQKDGVCVREALHRLTRFLERLQLVYV
jgi:HPt (histidine-containing phosphotransfer) domain-containing protein